MQIEKKNQGLERQFVFWQNAFLYEKKTIFYCASCRKRFCGAGPMLLLKKNLGGKHFDP